MITSLRYLILVMIKVPWMCYVTITKLCYLILVYGDSSCLIKKSGKSYDSSAREGFIFSDANFSLADTRSNLLASCRNSDKLKSLNLFKVIKLRHKNGISFSSTYSSDCSNFWKGVYGTPAIENWILICDIRLRKRYCQCIRE